MIRRDIQSRARYVRSGWGETAVLKLLRKVLLCELSYCAFPASASMHIQTATCEAGLAMDWQYCLALLLPLNYWCAIFYFLAICILLSSPFQPALCVTAKHSASRLGLSASRSTLAARKASALPYAFFRQVARYIQLLPSSHASAEECL